jgi:cellulose synthase/poly-beta-1,6-N-acetylglucosamine synthase-like glycosyltransferase
MHQRPKSSVSVVIPHLNEPDDLRRCLQALQAQRLDGIPFEVIVVDNGSRVSPAQVCDAFEGVRLALEKTPGPGPARSHGASLAEADLIAFVDADCLVAPGWLREIAGYFAAHPEIDYAGGDIQVGYADPSHPTPIELFEAVFGYRARRFVEREHYAATGNMVVRKQLFEAVGPFLGIGVAEDREWGQRAHGLGYRAAYLPRATVYTPACKTFTELTRRWDRAIAHDFEDNRHSGFSGLRWLARSLMIAMSPPLEWAAIIRSGKTANLSQSLSAFVVLARVRLYRARKMIALQFGAHAAALVNNWNRE